MKFYNPFKWHIVMHRNGRYAVRKFTLFFIFLDKDLENWWSDETDIKRRCMVDTYSGAVVLLQEYFNKQVLLKSKKWTRVNQ